MSSDTCEAHDEASFAPFIVDGKRLGEIITYHTKYDDSTVVEIVTAAGIGNLRVYVNTGTIFDQAPEESGPHGECGFTWRGPGGDGHRCGVMGAHDRRHHVCRFCTALGTQLVTGR